MTVIRNILHHIKVYVEILNYIVIHSIAFSTHYTRHLFRADSPPLPVQLRASLTTSCSLFL